MVETTFIEVFSLEGECHIVSDRVPTYETHERRSSTEVGMRRPDAPLFPRSRSLNQAVQVREMDSFPSSTLLASTGN